MKTYRVGISSNPTSLRTPYEVRASSIHTAIKRAAELFMRDRKDCGVKGEPECLHVKCELAYGSAYALEREAEEAQRAKDAKCAQKGHMLFNNGRGTYTCADCGYKRVAPDSKCSGCGDNPRRVHVVNGDLFCAACSPIQGHSLEAP